MFIHVHQGDCLGVNLKRSVLRAHDLKLSAPKLLPFGVVPVNSMDVYGVHYHKDRIAKVFFL